MKTLLNKASALIVTALLFSSTGNFLSAQSQYCGTDKVMQDMIKRDPNVLKVHEQLEEFTKEYIRTHTPETERGGPQYIIPIVFHIVHDNGVENISDNTVFQAVDILNKDYQKLNSDTNQVQEEFKPLIADCNIEFRLAQLDPDGNCTNGIDRIFSYRTYQGDDRGKLGIWDRRNYLNIWVVNRIADGNVAAYAYLPAGAAGLGYRFDGVIARYNYVGSDPVNGRTLTHEIGHSFNLSHPWGGGTVATACGDDGVDDTPVTEGGTSCPSNKVDFSCDASPILNTYQFNDVTTISGNTSNHLYVINPQNGDSAVTLTNFTASAALSTNSALDSVFAFTNWDIGAIDGDTTFANHTGSINTGKYYEFTVLPTFGQGMTLTGIRFFVRRNGTGPRMFSIRSNRTSNYGTDLTAGVVSANPHISLRGTGNNTFYFADDDSSQIKVCKITLPATGPNNYTNIDVPVTFRIYAWNAEDAAGTFEIDSVAVQGTFGIIENLDNYMDYTYCHHMFTIGQMERMHAALESSVSSRDNLWKAANHHLTGIDNPQICAPQPDFYVKKNMACLNDATTTVQFFDNSTHGTVTSRQWTIPGGTFVAPSTSTSVNPIVKFTTLWSQSATLTVTNTAGSNTVTKDNIVWVAPQWTDYAGTFSEDFEDATHFNLWRIDNPYNTASYWQRSSTGYFPSGNTGLKLNAYSPMILSTNTTPTIILDQGIGGFDRDLFISPSFDLSHMNTASAQLQFKLSAATRASASGDITEKLQVLYSTNCGNTWVSLINYTGTGLCNAGSFQEAYTPTTSAQWVTKLISLPSLALKPNVRFKFEYTSGDMSNNVYIDDINITGTVGIEDNNPGILSDMSVYPNPANGEVSISYMLSASRDVKLQVFDALGNLVKNLIDTKQAAGNYNISFNTVGIANGIYHVTLSGDNVNLRTEKLVIIR